MYNQPKTGTYNRAAATISTAATLMTVTGPRGHKGRLVGIAATVTTNTTGDATLITVGNATTANKYGTLSVPIATAGAAATYNNATITDIDANIIPADSAVVIATNGGCTAGAADVAVMIDWFK
jgi:hypothetical protein